MIPDPTTAQTGIRCNTIRHCAAPGLEIFINPAQQRGVAAPARRRAASIPAYLNEEQRAPRMPRRPNAGGLWESSSQRKSS